MNIYAAQQDERIPDDTSWTMVEDPSETPTGPLEQVMLAEDKLFVVLAVVLVIWIGMMFFMYRTDRKVQRLERRLDNDNS